MSAPIAYSLETETGTKRDRERDRDRVRKAAKDKHATWGLASSGKM